MDFFNSRGISRLDLADLVSRNASVLKISLQGNIIPHCDTLKNIVHTDKNVVTIIRHNSWLLTGNLSMKSLLRNIEFLRDEGIPQSIIDKFLVNHPRALAIGATKFEEIVKQIKGMGFDSSKYTFLVAIKALAAMTKSTWETKLNAYRKWSWSEEEIQNAFKKHPICMMQSEKKIMLAMDYLVNQMDFNPSLIAKCPVILGYSLEKRIIPRCAVIQFLISRGHIQKQISQTVFKETEKYFLEKFVGKYEAEVPELLKVYHTSLSSKSSYASNEMNML